MVFSQRPIGLELVGLSNLLRRTAQQFLTADGSRLTSMQMMVLGYLDEHRNQDIFQKDIERVFQIRRSTATGVLQVMERERYIVRGPMPNDARLKKLMLTDRGETICSAARRQMELTEARIRRGMSERELETLIALIDRIRENLEAGDS